MGIKYSRINWTPEDDKRRNEFYDLLRRECLEHPERLITDPRKILGDPAKGVSFPRTIEEARDYLLRSLESKFAA